MLHIHSGHMLYIYITLTFRSTDVYLFTLLCSSFFLFVASCCSACLFHVTIFVPDRCLLSSSPVVLGFFSKEMRNNNATTFSCAHNLFDDTFFSPLLHPLWPTGNQRAEWNVQPLESRVSLELINLFLTSITISVTRSKPSNESRGRYLTSGSIAFNHTD